MVGAQAGQGAILVYFDDLTVSDSNKAAALIPLDAAASVEVCTADGRGPSHQWMLRAAGREYLFGVESEAEAFFLRISDKGDYRYEGADLGILITRGRAMDNKFRLTKRSKQWIEGIKSQCKAKPLPKAQPVEFADPAFKIL